MIDEDNDLNLNVFPILFWPISLCVILVWYIAFRPWGWLFNFAEYIGEKIHAKRRAIHSSHN